MIKSSLNGQKDSEKTLILKIDPCRFLPSGREDMAVSVSLTDMALTMPPYSPAPFRVADPLDHKDSYSHSHICRYRNRLKIA